MTTLDRTAIKAAHDAALPVIGQNAALFHVIDVAVTAYLESLPTQPVEVTEEMVERAAAFLARQHPNSYASIDSTHVMVDMSKPNDHARTMSRRLLDRALIVPQEAVKE